MAAPRPAFAQRVTQLRDHLQLTQEELAHELGVSFATVNRWENARTEPSQLARSRLAEFCRKMQKSEKLAAFEPAKIFNEK